MPWKFCLCLFLALAGLGAERAIALSCMTWSGYEVAEGKVFHNTGSSRSVTGLDPRTFRPLLKSDMGSCSAGYAADATTVIYEGKRIPGADAASINVTGMEGTVYAKDRHRVYAGGKEIPLAVGMLRVSYFGYATDGMIGYFGSRRLPGNNFIALRFYAKSAAAVFHNGKSVPGIDPKTFEELRDRPTYGRDSRSVLFDGRRIDGAHSPSFEIISPTVDHARDRARVYYRGDVIVGADPGTMREIQGYCFRDKRAVYLEGREIAGADPATFRLTKFGQYGMDSKRVYRLTGGVLDRDPASFQELQAFYTKDKNGVYYQDQPMLVADPQSFHARAMNNADDKVFRYSRDQVVCKHQASAPGSVPLCK